MSTVPFWLVNVGFETLSCYSCTHDFTSSATHLWVVLSKTHLHFEGFGLCFQSCWSTAWHVSLHTFQIYTTDVTMQY